MRANRLQLSFGAACASTALSLFLVMQACGSSQEPPPEYPPAEDPGAGHAAEPPPAHVEAPPPPPPVQVVAGENTALDGAAPALAVKAPRNGQKIKRGDVSIRATLRNWELGADPGNHVHLIVDNEPYMAIRDLAQPLNLNQLVRDNLGHELTPGNHVVRMFPSRSHHESVKVASAFAMFTFEYQTPTEGFSFDPRAPLLTYSRPKGCNTAGERVMLDFFLANIDALAADGFRVRYSIDGQTSGEITSWAPHYIENLTAGDHTIQLTLIGADGQPVPGMFNDTTRTISVQAECPAATPPPAPDAAPSATGTPPPQAPPAPAAGGPASSNRASSSAAGTETQVEPPPP